jgi:uncharacterized protein with PIN domain
VEAPRVHVVLDSSAVIALFRDEPASPLVEETLRSVPTRMSTVNAGETVDVLVRVHGWALDDVVGAVEQLLSSLVEPVAASSEVAMRAGELRARHFGRDKRLSLADCFVLATAEPNDRIATTDAKLAATARAEGYEVVSLG